MRFYSREPKSSWFGLLGTILCSDFHASEWENWLSITSLVFARCHVVLGWLPLFRATSDSWTSIKQKKRKKEKRIKHTGIKAGRAASYQINSCLFTCWIITCTKKQLRVSGSILFKFNSCLTNLGTDGRNDERTNTPSHRDAKIVPLISSGKALYLPHFSPTRF